MRRSVVALVCAAALAAPAFAAKPALTVERVVILMRHGVRPPTKNPPMADGVAADPWPAWSVKPGWLTPHGAEAVRLLGRADRVALAKEGVLPASGCPDAETVAVISDSDQRTIATGDAWIEGVAPGCAIANQHKNQDDLDPLFSPPSGGEFDPDAANGAVSQALGTGGIAAAERRDRAALAAIDRAYCGSQKQNCGVTTRSSNIAPATPTKKPKLKGALDLGSTAAQILLLEYADGKPMADVGWGRVSPTDIALVGSLHSTEFAILARPRYLAKRNVGLLASHMRAALRDDAPKATIFVGHDTTVASLSGLLDLHWQVPGFAADDPAPGGALVLERVRDGGGRLFIRAAYRSQSLDQIRTLAKAPPVRLVLPIGGCPVRADRLCPIERFEALLAS